MGQWSVMFIFTFRGSVIPRALAWALPNAVCAIGVQLLLGTYTDSLGDKFADNIRESQIWQGYNFLIAFLLTFRTGQAYSRWWEGGTLLQQARGEWFNAYSSLIAFSSSKDALRPQVKNFQQLLSKLMSLVYCTALEQISQMDESNYELLDLGGVEKEKLEFLKDSSDKVEVVVLWIQRLVVENMSIGVVDIPPPILSRVFQELSRGVVNINNVRKITEFLFPFPYAQLITVMLLLHWVITPVMSGILLTKWYWAALVSFISVFAFWSLNYIASEIECPFGDDDNDLPMHEMVTYMNRTLVLLLEEGAQIPPKMSARPLLQRAGTKTDFKALFHKGGPKQGPFEKTQDGTPTPRSGSKTSIFSQRSLSNLDQREGSRSMRRQTSKTSVLSEGAEVVAEQQITFSPRTPKKPKLLDGSPLVNGASSPDVQMPAIAFIQNGLVGGLGKDATVSTTCTDSPSGGGKSSEDADAGSSVLTRAAEGGAHAGGSVGTWCGPIAAMTANGRADGQAAVVVQSDSPRGSGGAGLVEAASLGSAGATGGVRAEWRLLNPASQLAASSTGRHASNCAALGIALDHPTFDAVDSVAPVEVALTLPVDETFQVDVNASSDTSCHFFCGDKESCSVKGQQRLPPPPNDSGSRAFLPFATRLAVVPEQSPALPLPPRPAARRGGPADPGKGATSRPGVDGAQNSA